MRARAVTDQRGFSLIELLVVMVLFMIVLSATFAAFEAFNTNTIAATVRQDSQDRLRTALDRIARDLRGVAGAGVGQPAIENASPFDLMFLSVDSNGPNSGYNALNLRRVRYCVDSSSPANERLWLQTQTWTTAATPAPPSTASCPDASWGNQQLYADSITNNYNGQTRSVFSYDSTDPTAIALIHADVFVNTNTHGGPPTESHLSTGVFLRNQDRAPVGAFTAVPQTNYRVILNGAGSYSPQGSALNYVWYDGSTQVGTGQTFVYTASSGGSHTLSLKVYDPAGLEGDAPAQTVTLFQ